MNRPLANFFLHTICLSSLFVLSAACGDSIDPSPAMPGPDSGMPDLPDAGDPIIPTELGQTAYVKGSETAELDFLGSSVAISGDTLVVGAPQSFAAGKGGVVYVYRKTASGWEQEGTLTASNSEAGDAFGTVVAIDGDVIAVGASNEDSADASEGANNEAPDSGAVYVYRRTGTEWTEEAYVKAGNLGLYSNNDAFGEAISLRGDVLVVGATGDDNNAQEGGVVVDSGAVYVFRFDNGAWVQEDYLHATTKTVEEKFGSAVSIFGERLAIGATDAVNPNSRGSVHVFQRTEEGSWAEEVILRAESSADADFFGYSVSLSRDALAVGMPQFEAGNGAVLVFRRGEAGWSQEVQLSASSGDINDLFGEKVALEDGVLLVGARYEGSSSVGIGGSENNNNLLKSGAAYVFQRDEVSWAQTAYIKASVPGAGDAFGYSVAVSGETMVIGAIAEDGGGTGVNGNEDDNTENSGAAYIFEQVQVLP